MKKIVLVLALFFFVVNSPFFVSIASAQVAQPVTRNLSVSADVIPQQADFQFKLDNGGKYMIAQEQEIRFEITYGASSSAYFATTNTIVVDYSNDKAPDGTHVVDYVFGSSATAFGNAMPIVDTKLRTITWIIRDLPAGTMNQKLTFSLRANGHYTTSGVNFRPVVRMSNAYVTMPELALSQRYEYDPSLVKAGPTTTPAASTPAPTTLPTPQAASLRILDVYLSSITDKNASIAITTSQPARIDIRYGTSSNTLNQLMRATTYAINNSVPLSNLTPETEYFFRIVAIDRSGKTVTSEILTFTTAKTVALPNISDNAVFIVSDNTTILSGFLSPGRKLFGILTENLPYQLTYTFNTPLAITSAEILVKDSNGTKVRVSNMTPLTNHVYTSQLRTDTSGMYDLFISINTLEGYVIEQRVAQVKVIKNLTILEENSLLPISGARVSVENINTGETSISYADNLGEITTLLKAGNYKATAHALGYDGKTVEFTIGEAAGQEAPVITLHNNFFNLEGLLLVAVDWLINQYNYLLLMTSQFAKSIQVFHSTAYFVLLSFVTSSFLLFRIRTNIRLRDLVPFFIFNILFMARRHKNAYLYGLIVDSNKQPIIGARVEIIDEKNGIVLAHTVTNKLGKFVIANIFKQHAITMRVSKEGYTEAERLVPTDTKDVIIIKLEANKNLQHLTVRGIHHITAEFYELILLLCLLAELIFLFSFGIMRTLPFFILSAFNLILWLFYMKESTR